MTDKADQLIDLLREEMKKGAEFDIADLSHDLWKKGYSHLEVGWVLRHLFDLHMSNAVHLALTHGKLKGE